MTRAKAGRVATQVVAGGAQVDQPLPRGWRPAPEEAGRPGRSRVHTNLVAGLARGRLRQRVPADQRRKVWIRPWLAELLGVSPRTVSTWVAHGLLRNYTPEAVRDFLARHPRVRNRLARTAGPWEA